MSAQPIIDVHRVCAQTIHGDGNGGQAVSNQCLGGAHVISGGCLTSFITPTPPLIHLHCTRTRPAASVAASLYSIVYRHCRRRTHFARSIVHYVYVRDAFCAVL
jgi:hypothetical protein